MITSKINVSLRGFEIGISGAVPDRVDWDEPAQDRAVLEFISLFSGLVVKYGGRIVHGSHPSLTPVIVRQTERQDTHKPVTLFMSELWSESLDPAELNWFERTSEFITTPKVGTGGEDDANTRNHSLTAMRRAMVQRMNTMVVVGGKQHAGSDFLPGVTEELKLAQMRGMPCFLVGGLGGMTSAIARQRINNGEIELQNGLSVSENEQLMTTKDIASCVSIIFEHLAKNPSLRDRALADLL